MSPAGWDGCHTQYVGAFSEEDVSPTDDGEVHNGVRDLLAVHEAACTKSYTTYIFDGERYEHDNTDYVDLCSH